MNKKNIQKITGIERWLNQQKNKSLLRFLTCGSVDDGKSTLIGRLLHDTQQIYEDQLLTSINYSKKRGSQKGKLDLSLLIDGLQAEIEQGITIDVAYKYFSTNLRKFIIADTPGHEQYTRNMATGASNCDLAILLIDARKGILNQTKRHSFIVTLLGIKNLIVAVNKMDLINYQQVIFEKIKNDFIKFSKKLPKDIKISFIPISALLGINIVTCGGINWYKNFSLLEILEKIEINNNNYSNNLIRFPIQYVIHPNLDFRGYLGTLESGTLSIGQKIKVLPSNNKSVISRIITFKKDLKQSITGQSVALVLKDNIDISRGDLIISANEKFKLFSYALVNVIWMYNKPLNLKSSYLGKIANKKVIIFVNKIHYKININNFNKIKTNNLSLNSIGLIDISFNEPMAIDIYQNNKITGGIIFIDTVTNITVGAGMIYEVYNKKEYKEEKKINQFELDLNKLIIKYFPHHNNKDIINDK